MCCPCYSNRLRPKPPQSPKDVKSETSATTRQSPRQKKAQRCTARFAYQHRSTKHQEAHLDQDLPYQQRQQVRNHPQAQWQPTPERHPAKQTEQTRHGSEEPKAASNWEGSDIPRLTRAGKALHPMCSVSGRGMEERACICMGPVWSCMVLYGACRSYKQEGVG